MATHYSSGQYEDAYNPRNLRNWNLPRVCKQRPSAREGYTQFIANDRGHLLPSVPHSEASPWGTYMGTWDMPLKIPPAQVSLTSRSVDAAARLTEWINKSRALSDACNGMVPQITGKPSIQKVNSAKPIHPSRKVLLHPDSVAKMPAQGEIKHSGSATLKGPLSRQPGRMDLRLNEDSSLGPEDLKDTRPRADSDIPLSRQPGSMDVRLSDASLPPKAPALSRPISREPTPRRATSAEAPPSGRPRSLEGKPKGASIPELLAACRPESIEASAKNAPLLEAAVSSRPTTKGSQPSEVRKTPIAAEEGQSKTPPREGPVRPLPCPEEPSC